MSANPLSPPAVTVGIGNGDPSSDATSSDFGTEKDLALVDAIKRGDLAAFEDFFDRYFRLVYAVARRILEDEGEAQDIAQDVFFRFVQTIGNYDPRRGTPRTWLLAIATSRSLDQRRHLVLRRFYNWVELEHAKLIPTSTRYDPPAITAQIDLDAALAGLTDPQRRVIELHCIEGLTFPEIAVILGKSKEAAGQIYSRGIQEIRDRLKLETPRWNVSKGVS